MQPVSNVLIGSSAGLQPRPIQTGQFSQSPTNSIAGQTQSISTGSLNQSMAISRVHSQVTELLQSVGGGLENDKMLQLLIATILLMALLQGSQSNSQSGADILRSLGGGRQDQSQTISLLSSSTSIAFQQTSISMVSVSGFEFGSSADAGGVSPVGHEFDASA